MGLTRTSMRVRERKPWEREKQVEHNVLDEIGLQGEGEKIEIFYAFWDRKYEYKFFFHFRREINLSRCKRSSSRRSSSSSEKRVQEKERLHYRHCQL